jgi:hypothetical protein
VPAQVAAAYGARHDQAIVRDLNALESLGLIERIGKTVRATFRNLIEARQPRAVKEE